MSKKKNIKQSKKAATKTVVKNDAVNTAVETNVDEKTVKQSKEIKVEEPVKEIPETPQDETLSVENGGITVEPAKTEEETPKKTPIVEDDHVKVLQDAMNSTSSSGLDANHRVELMGLIRKTFVDEERPQFIAPTSTRVHMNKLLQIGIVAEMAQEAMSGKSSFAITLQKSGYSELLETAKELGVTLPSLKLIEANTSAAVKKQGNVTVPVGKGSGVKVSAEAKKQLEEDREIQSTMPELDPLKIVSEDDLKKAIDYMFRRKNNFGRNLVDVVDFMRNYRINQASQAENSTEAMMKLDERTTTAWLDDIFRYASPSFITGGLSAGLCATIDQTNAPVRAFTILRESIKDGDGKPVWDDQSIADAVTAIVKWKSQLAIDADTANLNKLGDSKKYDTQSKQMAEAYNKSLAIQQKRIDITLSPESEFMSTFLDKLHAGEKNHVTLAGVIRRMYYPETLTKENKDKEYENLEDLILQHIGVIFNMFRPAGDKVEGYSIEDLPEPIEATTKKTATKKETATKKQLPRGLLRGAYLTSGSKSRRKFQRIMNEFTRVLLLKNNQLSKLKEHMKKLSTILCCTALAIFGWVAGINNRPLAPPTQTVQAAQIPLDLKLGRVETIRDTVYLPSDTVYAPAERIVVTKTKKVAVPYKVIERDTLYVPTLILAIQTDRMPTAANQAENDSVQTE